MLSLKPLFTGVMWRFQIPLIDVSVHFEELRVADLLSALPSIDTIITEFPLVKAFLEVYRVLNKRNISARVALDYDPDYGSYIAVETELKASRALDLWMELMQVCRGFGVFVSVTWTEEDLPRYEVLHRLAKILAESGLKLRFAESINVVELVRELREE